MKKTKEDRFIDSFLSEIAKRGVIFKGTQLKEAKEMAKGILKRMDEALTYPPIYKKINTGIMVELAQYQKEKDMNDRNVDNEVISAFAYRTGKQIEELIKKQTNDLWETNQLLEAKILDWWNTHGRLAEFADYFGVMVCTSGKVEFKENIEG